MNKMLSSTQKIELKGIVKFHETMNEDLKAQFVDESKS